MNCKKKKIENAHASVLYFEAHDSLRHDVIKYVNTLCISCKIKLKHFSVLYANLSSSN